MTVFDQKGQKVDQQYNVAGDYNQSKSGDNITISGGDFRGAMVNLKSTLTNVTQTINTSSADPALKDELTKLFEQLTKELEKAPADKQDEVEAVAQTAATLVQQATAAKPNKPMLKITGEGLKQAAENIKGVLPTVIGIATQIVAAVFKLAA